jgi:hypothetical protein
MKNESLHLLFCVTFSITQIAHKAAVPDIFPNVIFIANDSAQARKSETYEVKLNAKSIASLSRVRKTKEILFRIANLINQMLWFENLKFINVHI